MYEAIVLLILTFTDNGRITITLNSIIYFYKIADLIFFSLVHVIVQQMFESIA